MYTCIHYALPLSCAGESAIDSDAAVQAEFAEVVEEAIKRKGKVDIEVSKIVFLGPSEAGKTQLKYALMGNYEKSTNSTPLSAGAKQVVERYVDKNVLTKDMLREALYKSAKDWNEENDKVTAPSSAGLQHHDPQTSGPGLTSDRAYPQLTSGSAQRGPLPSVMPSTETASKPESSNSPEAEESQDYDDFSVLTKEFVRLTDAVQTLSYDSVKEGLRMRYIHLIDNGGQPAFFDAHPVVATSRATYVLVYNMQEGLNAMPKYTYRKKGCTEDDEVHIAAIPNDHYSNLDLLKQSLRTVGNLKHKFEHFEEKVCSEARPPYVVVVGTRYSEPGREGAGTIDEQNKQLSKECSLYPAWENAQKYKDMYIFPVDCLKPNCPGVQAVRDRISCDGSSLKLTIPISWFQCHLLLWYAREERVDSGKQKPSQLEVLPYSVLFQLCHEQGLVSDEHEMLAMVRAFHMLGLFLFPAFKPVEPYGWQPEGHEPVFTNPDLLYAELTKILEITFENRFPRVPCAADDNRLLKQLKEKGELTRKIMGRLDIPDKLDHIPDFHGFLLHQLSTWGLAAELPTSISQYGVVETAARDPVYFVPCILRQFQQGNPFRTKPDPELGCIYLTIGEESTYYILNGIFIHFVTILLHFMNYSLQEGKSMDQNRCSDSVALFRPNTGEIQFQYKVRVTNDKLESIKIYISPVNPDMKSPYDYHQIIWRELKVAMEEACEQVYCKKEMFSIVVATVCGSSECDTDLPHLAKLLTKCPCGGTTDPYSAKPSDVSCLCEAAEYDLHESSFLKKVKDACKSKYDTSSMYYACMFHFPEYIWGSCATT